MASVIIILSTLVQSSFCNLWVDKTHSDFQAGQEYHWTPTQVSEEGRLATWQLGAYWWSPHSGGLRILGKDMDFDDNGYSDVLLPLDQGTFGAAIYWNFGDSFGSQRTVIPTPNRSPQAIHVADIDGDGYADMTIGTGISVNSSYVFYGTQDPRVFRAETIKAPYATYGAQDVCIVDINGDGYVDLWITGTDQIWVLYGPDLSYRNPDRTLSIPGGYFCRQTFADVNGDGCLDVVMGQDNGRYITIAYGPDFSAYQQLPSSDAHDVAVCDLNSDGYLDLLSDACPDKYIFWGSANGYSVNNRTVFPGNSEGNCAIEDLNNDGCPDLFIGDFDGWSTGPSLVCYGPDFCRRQILPGGHQMVCDYNNDGFKDILSYYYNPNAKLFWNRDGSFDSTDYTSFPCICDDGLVEDMGNIWDRSSKERFLSRVHDVIPDNCQHLGTISARMCCIHVGAYGCCPDGIHAEIQVRSSWDAAHWGRWCSPTGSVPDGAFAGGAVQSYGRYYQYRLVADLDYHRTTCFVVDSVKGFLGDDAGSNAPAPVASTDDQSYKMRIRLGKACFHVASHADFCFCDVTGRVAEHLSLAAGEYEIPVPSKRGVYLARLTSGSSVQTAKLVIPK